NHLSERVGIEPGDRDFSVFNGQTVRGLIVKDPQAPRQTLEFAAMPYKAEFYETVDGLLTGTYFGGSSVVTIDPNDLGMQDGDAVELQGEMGNKLEFNLVVDDQLPRQISVTAYDPTKDHETTTAHAYRMQGFAQGVEQISLPMTLLPDEARQTAERLLYQRHVERESSSMRLPWKYCWVNPTDIVTVNSAGIAHKLRFSAVAGAVPGLLEVQTALDNTDVYTQTIAGDRGGGHAARKIPPPAESIALLIDTVMLRDADDKAGFYAAIVPRTNDAWTGAGLYRDRGAGYELIDTFVAPAVAGVLVNPV